ncbi:hypothetical protein [Polynucleobacter sp. JS-JIR-II-50]|uniref:hypothetical protein n=1 Tax=Polynucleobacter sp. JS-JIR-II-50 TaxID=2576919 RepID=UPI001BFD58A9|nr:hypothetical protein [Polynucleobacter sp. JS-JIR-II-50]QWE05338.1 hypothetical protein FD963_04725 [Polynucleobacter sp. JS-JIR-II-50]
MSDDNDSSGIIGTIISVLILAAIWPYLLALLGIYIAYMVVLAILAWIAEHWVLTGLYVGGALGVYAIFYYRLIPKAWKRALMYFQPKPVFISLSGPSVQENVAEPPNLTERKFIPSTNLYCYWCTKKLGIKAWEKNSKYYCDECISKVSSEN